MSKSHSQVVQGVIIDGTGADPYRGQIVIENGTITQLQKENPADKQASAGISNEDEIIVPGFIDLHCHGGDGGDFSDGTEAGARSAFLHHLAHGTTGMVATTMTLPRDQIEKTLFQVDRFRLAHPAGEMVIGVHLEGPFISPRWPGAQNPEHIALPSAEWLREWIAQYPGLIRMLTVAPERPGAEEIIRLAAENGIVPACGHTDASYEHIRDAIGWGLRHAVHCGNAMRGLHHREPGTLGAVLVHDEISTELILDGFHLHSAMASLILKAKQDQVCLVTDAIRASGMADGAYTLGGLDVEVGGGCARLGNGALAGSILTMDQALRNLVQGQQLSLPEAIRYITAIPARIIGASDRGTIAVHRRADFVVLDSGTLTVRRVMLGGRWLDEP
jgi:N-acetylglucosamine-6-phosphate deacetylase